MRILWIYKNSKLNTNKTLHAINNIKEQKSFWLTNYINWINLNNKWEDNLLNFVLHKKWH